MLVADENLGRGRKYRHISSATRLTACTTPNLVNSFVRLSQFFYWRENFFDDAKTFEIIHWVVVIVQKMRKSKLSLRFFSRLKFRSCSCGMCRRRVTSYLLFGMHVKTHTCYENEELANSKSFPSFKCPITPRKHVRLPRKLEKTGVRRFPTFHSSTLKKQFGETIQSEKNVVFVFHQDFVDLAANGPHHQLPRQILL